MKSVVVRRSLRRRSVDDGGRDQVRLSAGEDLGEGVVEDSQAVRSQVGVASLERFFSAGQRILEPVGQITVAPSE